MCPAIKRQTDCVRRSEVALDVSVGVRVRVRAFPSTSVLIVSQRMDVFVCVSMWRGRSRAVPARGVQRRAVTRPPTVKRAQSLSVALLNTPLLAMRGRGREQ